MAKKLKKENHYHALGLADMNIEQVFNLSERKHKSQKLKQNLSVQGLL
jgi:hypothetical protein